MDDKKITLVDEDETIEFTVVEETRLNGTNYLLVTDEEDEEADGDCFILKDMSPEDSSEALYEFVQDDDELDALMNLFMELLDDVEIEKK